MFLATSRLEDDNDADSEIEAFDISQSNGLITLSSLTFVDDFVAFDYFSC